MYTDPLNALNLRLEEATNRLTASKYNPFYYHGALPQFFMWVLFISGLMLFAYYVPTIDNAYSSVNLINAWTSVDFITNHVPFGAVIRGIHRYAADAMVIAVLLHIWRVWVTDRYRQYRIVQWLSGVVLLLLLLIIGQTGYYLVWDERSLVLTRMTCSSLDAIPLIGHGLKTWFLNGPAITKYTLSNFLFIHVGLSFALLFVLWIHYVRMTRPVLTPPPVINYILLALVFVTVAQIPIESGKMASLLSQPAGFDVDWFFLWPYVMLAHMPPLLFWTLMAAGVIALCLVPYIPDWLGQSKEVTPAEVVLAKCTGCTLCAKDCPYQAIEMVPAPATSRFKLLAVVKPYRCSACGVCVGACAFDAIDLPNYTDAEVTDKIKAMLT